MHAVRGLLLFILCLPSTPSFSQDTTYFEKDGTISNARVVQSVGRLLDKEAVRVVTSMPRWKPGPQDGEQVSVQFSLPIRFKISR